MGRRRAAVIAGGAYLAMFGLAIAANFAVIDRLVDPTSAARTATSIAAEAGAFRLATVAFLVIAVLDIVIAWALHVLLREVSEGPSRLAAWLRVAYGAVLAVAVGFLHVAGLAAAGDDPFGDLASDDRHALVGFSMATFDAVWLVGLGIFGLHLLVLGAALSARPALAGRTVSTGRTAAPRALGALVAIAGAAYLLDTGAQLGLPSDNPIAPVMLIAVATASMVAELWLAVWLLASAGRTNVHLDPPQVGIPRERARD